MQGLFDEIRLDIAKKLIKKFTEKLDERRNDQQPQKQNLKFRE